MPTEKVIKIGSFVDLKNKVATSDARFMNLLAMGIQERLKKEAGIYLKPSEGGLTSTGKSLVLQGEKYVPEKDREELDRKVRRVMDHLRIPSNLAAVIK